LNALNNKEKKKFGIEYYGLILNLAKRKNSTQGSICLLSLTSSSHCWIGLSAKKKKNRPCFFQNRNIDYGNFSTGASVTFFFCNWK
jgi:hypothetical protein